MSCKGRGVRFGIEICSSSEAGWSVVIEVYSMRPSGFKSTCDWRPRMLLDKKDKAHEAKSKASVEVAANA